MGGGARESLAQLGIEAVVTEVEVARDAALMYAGGEMPNLLKHYSP